MDQLPMDVLTGANLGLHLLIGMVVLMLGSAVLNMVAGLGEAYHLFRRQCLVESWPEVSE